MIPYIVTAQGNISFYGDSRITGVVPTTHPNYHKILEELQKKDKPSRSIPRLSKLLDALGEAKSQIKGLKVLADTVTYNDTEVRGNIVDKILEYQSNNWDFAPLVKFLAKLLENPDDSSRSGLYDWLVKSGLIIDKDGDVIGYKSVRMDYKDHHTGTIDNSVGANPKMKKEDVVYSREVCAAGGLHVGTFEHALGFQSSDFRLMVIKLNPKHVVCVPQYDTTKLRASEYKVIDELKVDCFKKMTQEDFIQV